MSISTCWSAGPGGRWPAPPWPCWAGPTAAGWWSWPDGATTEPTDGWPPACWPAGGRGSTWSTPGWPRRRPLRPGYRRRLRHRVPWSSTSPPAVPAGVPVLAVDIPSGIEGDTGAAAGDPVAADRTVTFVALKPGLVQGEGVGRAGRVEVADIGLRPGTRPSPSWRTVTWPTCVRSRPGRQQVVGRRPGGGRIAGHERSRRPLCPGRLPGGGGHGPSGRARRGAGRGTGQRGGERVPRGRGVGGRRPGGGRPLPGRGGRTRARAGRGHRLRGAAPGGRVAGPGGGRRRRALRPRAGVGGAPAPAGRPWCSPPTTASTPG